jgi:hypothetical protein
MLIDEPPRTPEIDAAFERERALVAFRLAFSTVNDALGAIPDEALRNAAPVEVRSSVTYGR